MFYHTLHEFYFILQNPLRYTEAFAVVNLFNKPLEISATVSYCAVLLNIKAFTKNNIALQVWKEPVSENGICGKTMKTQIYLVRTRIDAATQTMFPWSFPRVPLWSYCNWILFCYTFSNILFLKSRLLLYDLLLKGSFCQQLIYGFRSLFLEMSVKLNNQDIYSIDILNCQARLLLHREVINIL